MEHLASRGLLSAGVLVESFPFHCFPRPPLPLPSLHIWSPQSGAAGSLGKPQLNQCRASWGH